MASPTQPQGLVVKWTPGDVVRHLQVNGLDNEIAMAFDANKINGKHIVHGNDWDHDKLQRMGINAEGDRDSVLKVIKELKKNNVATKSKVFQDPLYGPIELHPLLVKIIDTPQFQRLRDIKQLGGVYYVYPGASHNRFEHSIGVCYLAGVFVESLQSRQPELCIDERDILCVKIAGLCHDIGHGPLSHLFQDLFIPEVLKSQTPPDQVPDQLPIITWKHEKVSVKLLDHLVKVNKLLPQFQKYGLDWEKEKVFIEELMTGIHVQGRPAEKSFLYEIVANDLNGIDVDKMDYIARDCSGLGIEMAFDWRRYIRFSRVIKCDDGKYHICPREKEMSSLYQLFETRNYLFRHAYKHKTKHAVEILIKDALIKADEFIKFPGENSIPKKMSETIDDMAAFTLLTDSVLQLIKMDPRPELKESRDLLEQVEKRDLYRYINSVLWKELPEDNSHFDFSGTKKLIAQKACNEENGLNADDVEKEIYADLVEFNYGKGEINPLDKVWFYRKLSPNRATKTTQEQRSHMLPGVFQEYEYRVYCKSNKDETMIKAIRRGFIKFCKEEPQFSGVPLGEGTEIDDDELPAILSPPVLSDTENNGHHNGDDN